MNDHDTFVAGTAKVGVAWAGFVIGGVTLSNIALILTIVFTLLQIWKLIRTEIRERRAARKASAEFAEKLAAPQEKTPDAGR